MTNARTLTRTPAWIPGAAHALLRVITGKLFM
jgi:hypothetical protein